MPQLRALIFDVDGTLADTERDVHRVAFNQAFAAAGLDWQWSVERYGELIETAGGKERIRRYVEESCPQFDPGESLTSFAANLHAAKNQYYAAVLQSGVVPLRPGVRRLLLEARAAGLRLAIATTSALPNTLAVLKTLVGEDSPDWFDAIAAGDMVAAKKPAPDIYLYALDKLGLPASDCLVVEDSRQGLRAAVAAGLPTIITVSSYTHAQDFSEAVAVLNHLGEPDQPCTLLSGQPEVLAACPSPTCVDLAWLQQLHRLLQG